jgi:hypothetical protein
LESRWQFGSVRNLPALKQRRHYLLPSERIIHPNQRKVPGEPAGNLVPRLPFLAPAIRHQSDDADLIERWLWKIRIHGSASIPGIWETSRATVPQAPT